VWYDFYMRYFDKTFFKFTLGFLSIIAISLLVIYFASNFSADNNVQTARPTLTQ